ncbi:MAG: AmmeMemoRadiSam system radical SAM enzyme [Firmicutes bacterium]|nr:AmmeMemoRadiSam system radical SAM enzyme [Bacillota bacterium]
MPSFREARFYERIDGTGKVRCLLCPKKCAIEEGRAGYCRVRRNIGGTLRTTGYARCSSFAVDPIEKKPLYHFYPGSYVVSVGTVGCNLGCRFCQNWQIAHEDAPTREMSPENLVTITAGERDLDRRVIGIAYTYSEPIVWYEYVLDTAAMAREAGLKNVFVTNGSINEEPLREMLPMIDAMNIDVKAFSNEYYRGVCSGLLGPVLRTVELVYESGCHVEVTTLLVPGLNDSEEEMRALSRWLASVSRDIPLHLSRYFPNYRMTLAPTPEEVLRRSREIASEELHFVYTGNVRDEVGQNTYCPWCGAVLIERSGLALRSSHLRDGTCPRCGRPAGIRGEVLD